MFENTVVRLADLCSEISYGYTASSTPNNVGPKFLRITDIQGGDVNWDDVPYCKISQKDLEKNQLENGDIVIARTGNSTGENYIFYSSEETVFASYLIRFRIDSRFANPYFVWLQLRTENWWQFVLGAKTGSAQAGANAKVLGQYEFFLPEREIQDSVSSKIYSIYRKLKLNTQTNKTLESIAQAIFKNWFVDFEPVKAKIAAKERWYAMQPTSESASPVCYANEATLPDLETYTNLAAMCAISGKNETELVQLQQQNPDHYQQLAETAALFPSAMVDSELGEIPEGWEVKQVGNYLQTISKTFPLKTTEEVIFLNTGDIQDGRFLHKNKSKVATLPGQAKKSIQKDDILYSEIRPENKRFAYVYFEADDYVVSTKLMVLRANGSVDSKFLYFLLRQQSVIDQLQIMAESRSGTFPQITFDVLSKIEFVAPKDYQVTNRFAEIIISPYMKITNSNIVENSKLAELRDSLLPKLLSGELSVSEKGIGGGC